MKILSILILSLLVIGCIGITKLQFDLYRGKCAFDHKLSSQCQYNIFDNYVDNVECSIDVYKSAVCQSSFSNCLNLDEKDEVPLVCWLCWAQSPATSDIYIGFQRCMKDSVFGDHLMVIVGLILISILIILA